MQYVFCSLCNANIGEKWGGKKAGKAVCISKFSVLRVDPRNYGNVCGPVANLDRFHEHKYFVISMDNIVTENPPVVLNINVQNGEQKFGEVCQFSGFVACSNVSSPDSVIEKVGLESISEFIRFFLTELEDQPCSSTNDAYTMESIQRALLEVQIKHMVANSSEKVCMSCLNEF